MTEQLTRDEILALKPGRELDALVAEKVMGWKTNWLKTDWYEEVNPNTHRHKGLVKDFKPSTDNAAAFEAEERAIDKDPSMYIHALASVVFGYSQVQDISDIRKMCMLIHATPEQRCKAAVLAVMDGEDKHGD